MRKKKIWVIIILFIVTIIASLVGINCYILNLKPPKQHANIEKVQGKADEKIKLREYRNKELGFVIQIPEQVAYDETFVPVKVFEDKEKNTVYLLRGEESTEYLALDRNWAFMVKSVKNDDELEMFIKEKFGFDCKLGKKEYMGNSTYNVEVISGEIESSCPLNYQYKVLYNPSLQKAMGVIMGQECSFSATTIPEYGSICYDEIIIKSFRFIK